MEVLAGTEISTIACIFELDADLFADGFVEIELGVHGHRLHITY